MAAAEARAAWQRTANQCFVQEDAKRAPKLAACSSSSPKVQACGDVPGVPDLLVSHVVPLDWNCLSSNLPTDMKWWLQLQPNFTYQKDFTLEQMRALEVELERMRDEMEVPEYGGDSHVKLCKVSATCIPEAGITSLKAVNSEPQHPLGSKKGASAFYFPDEDLMDWVPVDLLSSNQSEKGFSNMEWTRVDKGEPWWRTAEEDDLASLVAQKSLGHMRNCDLPQSQTLNVKHRAFSSTGNADHNRIFSSSLDHKMYCRLCSAPDNAQHGPAFRNKNGKSFSWKEVDHPFNDSEKASSATSECHSSTNIKEPVERKQTVDGDPSKAKLLEALRHSQTRAREAEEAARQAYSEKEHIVKLFFRQASQLFAYRQWLQLLQLETLYLQQRMKDYQISTLTPTPSKANQKNVGPKEIRKKGRPQRHDLAKCAIAFAVGFSLAGAGLLLGWTFGWVFPGF